MAQTTVTEFFQARKRNFDSGIIKKVNVNSTRNKQDKGLLGLQDVIPSKVNNSQSKTIKSNKDSQGLTEEQDGRLEINELNEGFLDVSKLETPKSSQSIPNTKTPLRQGAKKRTAPGVRRVPKRRKLDLNEDKSIKNFFNTVAKETETQDSQEASSSEPKESTKMIIPQTESAMVKLMSNSIPKSNSPLLHTPPPLIKTVENSVVKQPMSVNSDSSTLKKPSFDEIKAKLKTCGKLQELKQCLFKINESSSKLKDINVLKQKLFQTTSPIKITSPSKSPNKVPLHLLVKDFENNSLTSPSKVKAYERYHNLASNDQTKSLALPYKYKTLAEFFRCLDTVVCMLHNRKEVCTYNKVKTSVQQMIKKVFDKTKLAQIKTVFPRAYFYGLETVSKIVSNKESNTKSLIITPNFHFDESSNVQKTGTKNILDPTAMTQRKLIFHKHLVEITKKHHEVFLSGLNPPLNLENDRIIRWHPKFPLDDVPDIEPSPLPEDAQEKVQTAQDVLEKMKIGVCPRIEKALELVSQKKQQVSNAIKDSPKKENVSKALRGISQSLIDKIRAKESATVMREMLRNPDSEKRLSMLNRLPEFASILRSYFIQEKKAAIVMEDAVAKLFESYRTSISQSEVEDHIRLLAKTLPGWLSLIQIRKGLFLKIDKTKDLGVLKNLIEAAIKKEKSD